MTRRFSESPIGQEYSGLGRVLVKKHLGRIAFFEARFDQQNVQLILQKNQLDNFEQLIRVPVGSCFYFSGQKCVSRSGEPSIDVWTMEIIEECRHFMPDKFHGLTQSHRYEDRTLDLLTNEKVFDYFAIISEVIQKIREFLWGQGFKEFSTGVLQEYFEAGSAEPFSTSCKANGKTYYLSLTSEVRLKCLLVAGYDRVFEICQSFRNEGIDALHAPEFTLLEVYQVGANYLGMMELVENMIVRAISGVYPDLQIPLSEGEVDKIDFHLPFDRLNFHKACQEILGLQEKKCTLSHLANLYPHSFREGMSCFTWVFKLINQYLSPVMNRPTFITEIPAGISPFVHANSLKPNVTDRAALVVRGVDIADIYTDENNRSLVEREMRKQANVTGREYNRFYLELLDYGLPETAGIGLGVNRLMLLLRGSLPLNIKETILYPIK